MYKFISELNLDDSVIDKMDKSKHFQYIGGFYMYDQQEIDFPIDDCEIVSLSELAKLSFNTYDKESQMIEDMVKCFTKEKLSEIFNSNNPEKDLNNETSKIIAKYY